MKLPWKNQWFGLVVFTAFFSCGLLVYDGVWGKPKVGMGKGHFAMPSSLPSLPFFSKPGSLSVAASTEGAQVHIDGLPDQPVPASFPHPAMIR